MKNLKLQVIALLVLSVVLCDAISKNNCGSRRRRYATKKKYIHACSSSLAMLLSSACEFRGHNTLMPPVSHETGTVLKDDNERYVRGNIISECCLKPCSWEDLERYCLPPPEGYVKVEAATSMAERMNTVLPISSPSSSTEPLSKTIAVPDDQLPQRDATLEYVTMDPWNMGDLVIFPLETTTTKVNAVNSAKTRLGLNSTDDEMRKLKKDDVYRRFDLLLDDEALNIHSTSEDVAVTIETTEDSSSEDGIEIVTHPAVNVGDLVIFPLHDQN